jgi:hypothetical protein
MSRSTPSGPSPVSRRAFVGASVAGLATAVGLDALPLHALPTSGDASEHASVHRAASFQLEEITVAELQKGMASGRVRSSARCA